MFNIEKFKYSISGFAGGIGLIFTIASIFLMNPENMWRWVIYPESSAVKVERALTETPQLVTELKNKIQTLQQEILESKSQQISSTHHLDDQIEKITQEKEVLQGNLNDSKQELASLRSEMEQLQLLNKELKSKSQPTSNTNNLKGQINKITQHNKALQNSLDEINQKLVSLKSELSEKESTIKEKEELITLLKTKNDINNETKGKLELKQYKLFEKKPVILMDGNLSIATNQISIAGHYCYLTVRSFFKLDEEVNDWLEIGEPIILKINGNKHVIHLVDTVNSNPDYAIIDIYPVKTD